MRTTKRGRRLVLENVGNDPWRGTVMDVAFFPESDGTRVRVVQRNFPEMLREHVPLVDSGWACVLAILREYLEHHAGMARRYAEAHRAVPADAATVSNSLASAEAIARWAGERPERLLAATPHGAVASFAGLPGVFTFMGFGGITVCYTAWGEADLALGRVKAEELAEQFAAATRES